MAFNVRLMPVKVIDSEWDFIFDSPFVGTDDVVARGIRYAADNGAKVLNMSIGRDGAPAPVVRVGDRLRGLARRLRRGRRRQRVRRRATAERLAEFAPQIDGMVAVGAIGRDRLRASYSTTGSYIELVAPGGDFTRGGAAGGILQQTLDLDLVETYTGPVVALSRAALRRLRLLLLRGHVDGDAARLRPRGAADAAGHHQPRRPSKRS